MSSFYPKDILDALFSSLSEKTAGKRGLLMSGVLLCLVFIEEEAVLVVLIIFVLAGGALAVLAYENFATMAIEVHLRVFGWHVPALPLGVVVLLACLLGALLLYIVTVISAWRDRRQLAKLRKRVAELEQAQMNVYSQQYSRSVTLPMPGIQTTNSPPPWLN